MKRFLFTRLHQIENDYGFYIAPIFDIPHLLHSLITSEALDAGKKWLYLHRQDGKVTFGVRELLDLRDEHKRPITSFIGYQLEPHHNANYVPFHDALKKAFPAITAEVNDLQSILNAGNVRKETLNTTKTTFANGTFQAGNAWDEAVASMQKHSSDVLMLFDEHGQSKETFVKATAEIIAEAAKPSHTGFVPSDKKPVPSVERHKTTPATHLPTSDANNKKLLVIGGGIALLGTAGYWAFKMLNRDNNKHEKTQR